jgi:hypothetical protein
MRERSRRPYSAGGFFEQNQRAVVSGLRMLVLMATISIVVLSISGLSGATTKGQLPRAAITSSRSVECGSLDLNGMASGTPVSGSVTLGDISATLSGSVTMPTDEPSAVAGATITVFIRSKQVMTTPVAISQPLPGSPLIFGGFAPGEGPYPWSGYAVSGSGGPLCVARFGGSHPETTVLVGEFSGGAHCCTYIDAYPVVSNSVSPNPVIREIGNPGASLIESGGHAVIVTADNAFAYQFADYASSALPILTLEFRDGRFVVTTREHPTWVAADAGDWWATDSAHPESGLSALAAWAADECTLGQSTQLSNILNQLNSMGMLISQDPASPSGSAYVSQLQSFLSAHGYCS